MPGGSGERRQSFIFAMFAGLFRTLYLLASSGIVLVVLMRRKALRKIVRYAAVRRAAWWAWKWLKEPMALACGVRVGGAESDPKGELNDAQSKERSMVTW